MTTPVGSGPFLLRPLQMEEDIPVIHNWVNREYARYWQMQDSSLDDVRSAYTKITQTKGSRVFMGFYMDQPAFLLECYWVMNDPLGAYYDARIGDYGFHILVAPADQPIHNFTWHVFTTIIDFMLSDPTVERLVVEPDVRNNKIHVLNKRAGFAYQKIIDLPQKQAYLAFCTREQYAAARKADLQNQQKDATPGSLYTKHVPGLGNFSFRPLQIDEDIALIHNWVNLDYARYWQMQHTTIEQVTAAYTTITQAKHSHAFMGFYNNTPAFLWESYQAVNDPIGKYYEAREGDYGLHLLVAPVETPIHHFTLHILKTIIDFMLTNPAVERLIVEPDVRNEKMHVLTKRVGFEYQQEIQLPQKTAYLAFCTRAQYAAHDLSFQLNKSIHASKSYSS
ncbi:GNAT family N-acetyltransferase [uncultured Chitinophaga sp.]|uniref:GNAT family N-acetyltransferase n=1 Tax=uncultured Chitinophaga sp. TaxID=339340 RepID=UPI002632E9FB|nr:GNAT family N-acetyltransferase [uncultured Chitinophaga sp.]